MVPLNSFEGWAVLCGIGLGVGLWTLAGLLPRLRRPRLADRVAPYVDDISEGARRRLSRRSTEPLPFLTVLLHPVVSWVRSVLDRALGGSATIGLRLRQAGGHSDVERFRTSQLVWGIAGAGVGAIAAVLVAVSGGPAGSEALLVVVAAVAGVVIRDAVLQHSARRRLAHMVDELPTVLEFLTLSLSAGEGILDALRRVSRASRGELAREFAAVVAEVNTGLPLSDCLARLSSELRLAPLTRVIEQIDGALDRGTPLAEVLRAQAQDARENSKRALLEIAGKKEVAMLVPLIFLILPMTIIFAVFPGIAVLRLGL
ncbi:MAG: type II secretion system F family protein [Actinomycetota bacterium]